MSLSIESVNLNFIIRPNFLPMLNKNLEASKLTKQALAPHVIRGIRSYNLHPRRIIPLTNRRLDVYLLRIAKSLLIYYYLIIYPFTIQIYKIPFLLFFFSSKIRAILLSFLISSLKSSSIIAKFNYLNTIFIVKLIRSNIIILL